MKEKNPWTLDIECWILGVQKFINIVSLSEVEDPLPQNNISSRMNKRFDSAQRDN